MKNLSQRASAFLEETFEDTMSLLEALCKIPAPSHHEERRAEFCRNWLLEQGANGVYIDKSKNVVFPIGCENCNEITVFMAHTDTVFPDMDYPMPFSRDEKRCYNPGVGDDTVCLVMMLRAVSYILKYGLKPKSGVLFVANACEEGLGNLKGVKQIMEDYAGRVGKVYTFDAHYTALYTRCVGSHRYKIHVKTKGGHSYSAFGNRNAITAMAELICALDKCTIPQTAPLKTTYNFGIIEGGTSVNTIPQYAAFCYEYRSESAEALAQMEDYFRKTIEEARKDPEANFEVETIGIRPCGNYSRQTEIDEMTRLASAIIEAHAGMPPKCTAASTDANIPLSLGIPSICVGNYLGGGAHTREEYIEIESIPVGLKITADLILHYFAETA